MKFIEKPPFKIGLHKEGLLSNEEIVRNITHHHPTDGPPPLKERIYI